MKVLILCNDFPPLNSIGAQRPYSWYRHLKQHGIHPVVITKNWKGHSSTPQDVLKSAGDTNIVTEETEYGTIIRVPLRISPSEKMLLNKGAAYRPTLRRLLTLLYRMLCFVSARFDVNSRIYFEAEKIITQEKIDGIIITSEPFILFKYGYKLKRKYNIPWLADYRDGWKLNYVLHYDTSIMMKFLRRWEYIFEKKYLRTVNAITTVDPILASKLSKLHNKPAEVVYNGFDGFYTGERLEPTNTLPLIINHTGTLTPPARIKILLQAVKELLNEELITKNEISIRLIGMEYYADRLNRVRGFDKDVNDVIISTPRLSREEAMKRNTGADYVATFSEEEFKFINAKNFDYFAVKRPVLIIPHDESILSALVEELNAGFSPRDVAEMKTLLLNSIKLKREGKTIPATNIKEDTALFYTRSKQAGKLAEVMKRVFK